MSRMASSGHYELRNGISGALRIVLTQLQEVQFLHRGRSGAFGDAFADEPARDITGDNILQHDHDRKKAAV